MLKWLHGVNNCFGKEITMQKLIYLITTILAVLSTSAYGQLNSKHLYSGGAVGNQTLKHGDKGFTDDYDFLVVSPIIGYQFHPNFSIEGRAGFAIDNDESKEQFFSFDNSTDYTSFRNEAKLDSQYGAALKTSYPLFDAVSFFASVGYYYSSYKIRGIYDAEGIFYPPRLNADFSESGLAAGFGAQYFLTRNWQVAIEYQYFDQDHSATEAINLNINYHF